MRIEDLDTPALVVNLDLMEANIVTLSTGPTATPSAPAAAMPAPSRCSPW